MKKFLTFIFVAFLGIAAMSSLDMNFEERAISLKSASANSLAHVKCNCAFLGGNDNCLANNYGSVCASGENINCQDYNSNCGKEQNIE